jgi:hypothetical protein
LIPDKADASLHSPVLHSLEFGELENGKDVPKAAYYYQLQLLHHSKPWDMEWWSSILQ